MHVKGDGVDAQEARTRSCSPFLSHSSVLVAQGRWPFSEEQSDLLLSSVPQSHLGLQAASVRLPS